ncbi:MAG: phosphatidylserine decarboxylase family protein [Cytophagales bacterium]
MIHKEGRVFLVIIAIVFVAINVLAMYFFPEVIIASYVLGILSFGGFLFFLQFFRNPKRITNKDEKNVIAPADGKVVVIEETKETEYLNEQRIQVSIFMSPLNVHVNRNPVTGTISYFKYHPGKYLVAWHPKSSTENERTSIVFKLINGTEIMLRQIAGAAARRIKWYVDKGSEVEQGGEFGFIKFGSRVDLFLPLNYKIKVKIGEHIKGGITTIAEIPD